MLLKLTNAVKDRKNQQLIINTDYVMSVFEHTQEDGTKVTGIFGSMGNTWEIFETIDEVMAQIKE